VRDVGLWQRTGGTAERLAVGLGWFSLGLGLAEVVAPGRVARAIGSRDNARLRAILIACGLREIAAGAGILTRPRPAGWMWARVVGDLLDLAILGSRFTAKKTDRSRLVAATIAVAGVTALDAKTAFDLSLERRGLRGPKGIHVMRSITVNRAPEDVYRFWHRLENLPLFMDHLESVTVENGRSHWKARAPAAMSVEWDAEIVTDRPNEAIAWRSVEGADVPNRGSVTFRPAPGGRGTELHVELEYEPPGGRVAGVIAKLFGEEPGEQIEGDLRRFKQVMETGEVLHSDASIYRGMHAAQPPEELPHAPGRQVVS
jgi:uncharacterized membrane protein